MSVYTNDVDTLRQMFSQSIPQMFASLVTIVVVFLAMLVTNPLLTAVVVLCVCGMLLVTRSIAGRSGKYFMRQQEKLGDLNGYIEEMVNGQKVVKVFCHEQKAQEGFDRVNDALFESADMANKYANILMPIMVNIGNIQYVIGRADGAGRRRRRRHAGRHRVLPPAVQKLFPAHQPDLPAAQLGRHGPCGRGADLRADG